MIDEKKLIEKIEKMVIPLSTPDGSESIDIGINGYNECLVDVLETIKEQPKVGEWIPVEERLPEEPEQNPELDDRPMELYLVDNGEGSPFRAFWNGKYFHDGWRRLDVLAWMPLPEPFKGD